MTSLKGDIVNRVRRLPKPSKAAEALQPLLEAVSNAMHAVEDSKAAGQTAAGRIDVNITPAKSFPDIAISVADNGIGLDPARFQAFVTTDTNFKFARGGKAIGRLLWLDAFDHVRVVSIYNDGTELKRREFDFVLADADQVRNESVVTLPPSSAPTGTVTTFRGLREASYQKHFPIHAAKMIRQFGSHFLADFILGNAPTVTLTVGGKSATFPDDIRQMLVEDRGVTEEVTTDFGKLKVHHFIFRAAASAGFDGKHQLHMIANNRTVTTRKIDGLLGLGRFGPDKKGVYHGCVVGEFLDQRVNQERTHFNFDEDVAIEIAKVCASVAMRDALAAEIASYDAARLVTMKSFLSEYPSFGFLAPDDLLRRTPKNATKSEQFAQALIPTRIRRDVERKKVVQEIVDSLGQGSAVSGDFASLIRKAADEVHAEEQRQLTEYILRRKIVLDVLDVLVKRLREMPSGEQDFHLEETLHRFICPMKLRGDDPTRLEASDHDLWIIDERLAFAKYFASDVPTSRIIGEAGGAERPDVLVWDHLHGLGFDGDEPLNRVMIVEFKKPGRREYEASYAPANQIARYLNALAGGEIETYKNDRVRIAPDCVFSCYVVADLVGQLEIMTSTWSTTADGRGRWSPLSGKFRGSIEIIEWRDLLKDARTRNAAFIQLARS